MATFKKGNSLNFPAITESRAVSARELYKFLEVKAQFVDWAKRMFEYGFTEGVDYSLVSQKCETNNPKNPFTFQTDYALTLDTAKEISMIQRSEKGKAARQYFIEAEKELQQVKATVSVQVPQPKLVFNSMGFVSFASILAELGSSYSYEHALGHYLTLVSWTEATFIKLEMNPHGFLTEVWLSVEAAESMCNLFGKTDPTRQRWVSGYLKSLRQPRNSIQRAPSVVRAVKPSSVTVKIVL